MQGPPGAAAGLPQPMASASAAAAAAAAAGGGGAAAPSSRPKPDLLPAYDRNDPAQPRRRGRPRKHPRKEEASGGGTGPPKAKRKYVKKSHYWGKVSVFLFSRKLTFPVRFFVRSFRSYCRADLGMSLLGASFFCPRFRFHGRDRFRSSINPFAQLPNPPSLPLPAPFPLPPSLSLSPLQYDVSSHMSAAPRRAQVEG